MIKNMNHSILYRQLEFCSSNSWYAKPMDLCLLIIKYRLHMNI
ncbi:hypothetical protein HanIR_Chr04g0184741 [Helianthus annuus]|nr:hypothetical protein HanIR_Chr04g0184741 [Helianthus annuus]